MPRPFPDLKLMTYYISCLGFLIISVVASRYLWRGCHDD